MAQKISHYTQAILDSFLLDQKNCLILHKLAVTGNFRGSDAKSESDRICDLISEFYDCRYNVES